MKRNTSDEKQSWLSRVKVALAAFAFAGALVAGSAAIADTPVDDAPATEEVAWSSHSHYGARSVSWW